MDELIDLGDWIIWDIETGWALARSFDNESDAMLYAARLNQFGYFNTIPGDGARYVVMHHADPE